MFVTLKDWGDRDATIKEVINRLNGQLFFKIKGAQAFAFGPPAIPGLGSGSGFSIMVQDKAGNTPAYLAENTGKFLQAVNGREEIGISFYDLPKQCTPALYGY